MLLLPCQIASSGVFDFLAHSSYDLVPPAMMLVPRQIASSGVFGLQAHS